MKNDKDKIPLTFERKNVYRISAVLAHKYLPAPEQEQDWALVKLNKTVKYNKYLTLKFEDPYQNKSLVYALGHPHGLPMKYVEGGISNNPFTPSSNVNFSYEMYTCGGHSGSPIFNQEGNVIGIHRKGHEQCFDKSSIPTDGMANKISFLSFLKSLLDKLKDPFPTHELPRLFSNEIDTSQKLKLSSRLPLWQEAIDYLKSTHAKEKGELKEIDVHLDKISGDCKDLRSCLSDKATLWKIVAPHLNETQFSNIISFPQPMNSLTTFAIENAETIKEIKGLEEALVHLPMLQHFSLKGCKSIVISPNSAKALSTLKHLHSLDLSGCQVPQKDNWIASSLQILRLNDVTFSPNSSHDIENEDGIADLIIKANLRLEELELKNVNLQDKAAETLIRTYSCSLKSLHLTGNPLTQNSLEYLTRTMPPHLEKLGIGLSSLTDKLFDELVDAFPRSLHTLDLSGCSLKAQQISIRLMKLPQKLRELNLSGTEIKKLFTEKTPTILDDSGAFSLVKNVFDLLASETDELILKKAVQIDLNGCSQISDEKLLKSINGLSEGTLKKVNLRGCRLTKDIANVLKLKIIDCTALNLSSITFCAPKELGYLWKAPTTLKELHIDAVDSMDFEELKKKLDKIKILHLGANICSRQGFPQLFSKISNDIEELHLEGATFEEDTLIKFADKLKKCKKLALLGCKPKNPYSQNWKKLFANLPHLEELNLEGTPLEPGALDELKLPNCSKLKLGKQSHDPQKFTSLFTNLSNLQEFSLSSDCLLHEGLTKLLFSKLKQCLRLDLSGCNLKKEGWEYLFRELPPYLEELNLEGSNISTSSIRYKLQHCLKLNINNCKHLRSDDLRKVLSHLPSRIQELHLANTNLNDFIAPSFPKFEKCNLFNFSNCKRLTQDGWKYIFESLPVDTEVLDLSGADLDTDSIGWFPTLTRCRKLNMSNINLSLEDLEFILSKLPSTLEELALPYNFMNYSEFLEKFPCSKKAKLTFKD